VTGVQTCALPIYRKLKPSRIPFQFRIAEHKFFGNFLEWSFFGIRTYVASFLLARV